MHELIAAPFLGEHFLLRPGAVNGVKLPRAQYEELASAPADMLCPSWMAEAARRAFGLNLAASICKVGRDERISLVDEGAEGLARMGAIADKLMLRSGGCSGCALSGACTVCRPLARLYQQAKAPLEYYCQHGRRRVS